MNIDKYQQLLNDALNGLSILEPLLNYISELEDRIEALEKLIQEDDHK